MWRIYYDDGSYSDNEITQPFRVICIVQPREKTGREVVRGHPYYYLRNNHWYPAEDLPSLVQQVVLNVKTIDAIVMGIWTHEELYDAIIKRALTDDGFPRRSAEDFDKWR